MTVKLFLINNIKCRQSLPILVKGEIILNKLTNWENLPIALNAKQISEILNIALPNIYELFHRKDFPAIKISSKRIIVEKNQFKKWLDEQSGTASGV